MEAIVVVQMILMASLAKEKRVEVMRSSGVWIGFCRAEVKIG